MWNLTAEINHPIFFLIMYHVVYATWYIPQ